MPVAPAFLTPEVAFVLLAAAALGIVLETAVPGVGLGALTALVLLGLTGWALADLSPQPLGVLLALVSVALLVAGVFVRGRALWCAAGGLALLAAGWTLFPEPVSAAVLLPVAVLVPVAAGVLGRLVSRAWDAPAHRGVAGTLEGLTGVVREGGAAGDPLRVLVAGALWQATADEPLAPGATVTVLAQDDLELRVAAGGGQEGGDDAAR